MFNEIYPEFCDLFYINWDNIFFVRKGNLKARW